MEMAAPLPDPDQDAAYYRDVLHTLVEQGSALAARIHAAAMAATTPDSALPEAAIAFDRAARAVRRTIALARHIAAGPARTMTPDARTRARTRVIRAVEDAIHRAHRAQGPDVQGRDAQGHDAEALHAELAERMDDPGLEFDLEGCDPDQVIQDLCRDLGLPTPARAFTWPRRTPADVAHLRARAASPPNASPPNAQNPNASNPNAAQPGDTQITPLQYPTGNRRQPPLRSVQRITAPAGQPPWQATT